MNWAVNFYITGNGKMMKNGPYFIQIHRFLHQSALILKENHCLLSLKDDFSDFSQSIEKKLGCGWCELPPVCDHLDVMSYVLRALRTIQRTLNSIYTEILSSSR